MREARQTARLHLLPTAETSKSSARLAGILLAALAISCGGGSSASNGNSGRNGGGSTPSSPNTPGGSGSGAVTVSAGQQTSGVNIEVGSRTPSLSLVAVGTGNTASAVGVPVQRGTSATLLLAGQGIAQGTTYSVSEASPADITITQPSPGDFCNTTDGTPCVSFSISVNANAAPGPRNIMVTNSQGELAAFVGGLIVVAGP